MEKTKGMESSDIPLIGSNIVSSRFAGVWVDSADHVAVANSTMNNDADTGAFCYSLLNTESSSVENLTCTVKNVDDRDYTVSPESSAAPD